MYKSLVVFFSFFYSLVNLAQEGTSSPYSFYGIGEVKFKGAVENRSMGGVSIFKDSIHLNLQNPASYSGLKNIVFAVAGNTNQTTLLTNSQEAKTKRTSIDYIGLGMPITKKLGVSTGLISYSTVGYRVTQVNPNVTTASQNSEGSGGLNKYYLGAAYNILPELSLGINVDFNFGKINNNSLSLFNNVQYSTGEVNESKINGVNFTAGLMYESKFKSKTQIAAGLTFTPEHKLNISATRTIYNGQYLTSNQNDIINSLNIIVPDLNDVVPAKTTFGVGVGNSKKWQFGTEIVLQNTNNFGGKYNAISNISFEKTTQIKFGGYYIPKYTSFNSYFDRIAYKAGFNYQNLGMVINGKSIKEQTVTLGLGLPLYGVFSNINIGFELGKRGTKQGGLVQENFQVLTIGLSLNDLWFKRTKYE